MRGLKAFAFGAFIVTAAGFVAPQAADALVFGNSRNTTVNQIVTNIGNASVVTSGWYGQGVDRFGHCCDSGFHAGFNNLAFGTNYAVGRGFGGGETLYHDFWVFDIGSFTGGVTSASFQVFTYAINTADDGALSVMLGLFDVITPIPDLVADNNNRGDIFADLGSGTLYGTKVFANADSETLVTIPLDSILIANLNLAIQKGAKEFVIGGAIIPEPPTLALVSLTLVTLTRTRRHGKYRAKR